MYIKTNIRQCARNILIALINIVDSAIVLATIGIINIGLTWKYFVWETNRKIKNDNRN